ncbi:MAG: STAS domain-containing protein [Steroidobacteraceae bacterium]
MSASFSSTGPGRFSVSGPMTFETVSSMLQQGAAAFGQSDPIEIDLTQVGESDSAGLALLIEWKRLAREKNSAITFANMPPQLVALARISEVDELLGVPAESVRESEAATGG